MKYLIAVVAVVLPLSAQAQYCEQPCNPAWQHNQCFLTREDGTGSLTTSYTILNVSYAPPAPNSYVQYEIGAQTGTTTSTTTSWQDSFTVERGFDLSFHGENLLTVNVSFNNAFGGMSTQKIDQQARYTSATKVMGSPGDFINHDYDLIFLALGPTVNGRLWSECTYAEAPCYDYNPPCLGPCNCLGDWIPHIEWTLDLRGTLPQPVQVGWLKGTITLGWPPVRDFLASNGITAADYPQILAADPYANDPLGLARPDPTRFEYTNTAYPYEYIRTTFLYQTANNYSSLITTGASNSHTVKVMRTAGTLLSSLKFTNEFTYKHDSQQSVTSGSSNTETFFLTMPSGTYYGPTVMFLYIDKIYKTFMISSVGP